MPFKMLIEDFKHLKCPTVLQPPKHGQYYLCYCYVYIRKILPKRLTLTRNTRRTLSSSNLNLLETYPVNFQKMFVTVNEMRAIFSHQNPDSRSNNEIT